MNKWAAANYDRENRLVVHTFYTAQKKAAVQKTSILSGYSFRIYLL
jgi:hypothetical protein